MGKFTKKRKNETATASRNPIKSTSNLLVTTSGEQENPANIGDVVVKLSKQQKRDIKRAQKAPGIVSRVLPLALVGSSSACKSGASVYKRSNVRPPTYTQQKSNIPQSRFLNEKDASFNDVMVTSYQGFVIEKENSFNQTFHTRFRDALNEFGISNWYKFDITQPSGLGTKIAKTYVTRCVIGDAGITYKYLGLRIFAYPWSPGELGVTKASLELYELNQILVQHTAHLLQQTGKPETGSCQYNLTLINRCYPEGELTLKKEPMFEKDECTVSWHADSSLEHFSSIAVYQTTFQSDSTETSSTDCDSSWRIALRLQYEAEGPAANGKFIKKSLSNSSISKAKDSKVADSNLVVDSADDLHPETSLTPAVAIRIPNRSCYYLLDDFNHHHQHCVLVGNEHRYASTHRVSRVEGHSFFSIQSRCKSVLQTTSYGSKQLRLEQSILNELEFEWIRQYFVQGQTHITANIWWRAPMRELLNYWRQLEQRSFKSFQILNKAAVSATDNAECINNNNLSKKQLKKQLARISEVETDSYSALIEGFELRDRKRKGWTERCKDKQYRRLPVLERPVPPPLLFSQGNLAEITVSNTEACPENNELVPSPLNEDLGDYVRELIRSKELFILRA